MIIVRAAEGSRHLVDPNSLFTADDGLTISAACALIRTARCTTPTPALFLDRDGVMIEEKHYLSNPDHVQLIEGVDAAISTARELGWMVVVVTNQAGIGRGYYSYGDYLAVEHRVASDLARHGASVDAVFACPYHPEGQGEFRRTHPWRKPGPGMLLAAAHALNLDLSRSFMVGDRISDLQAGASAGIRAGALVETGYGLDEASLLDASRPKRFEVTVVPSIAALPKLLTGFVDRN